MKEPSLQKTTALSLAIHISFLCVALLLLRQSNKHVMPSPYVVTLVSPAALKGKTMDIRESKGLSKPLKDTSVVEAVPKQDMKKEDLRKRDKKMEKVVEERIAAIAAKKKVERLVKLRSEISLKASSDTSKGTYGLSPVQGEKGSLFDQYYGKISKEIHQQWETFPTTWPKDLEATISIKITKDGTIFIQKVEKSSGNSFFDKWAIRALTKASPLSPPPYEMEIGVRFYP
jgi:colicin import membrane protein